MALTSFCVMLKCVCVCVCVTGASGFVITPTAAEELGLESFGKLYAASISGKVSLDLCHT